MANFNPSPLTRFQSGHQKLGGRQQGSVSITTEIKQKLSEVPQGQTKTYLDLLIDKIFEKAIDNSDSAMIRYIWSYVDGIPTRKIQNYEDDRIDEIKMVIVNSRDEIKRLESLTNLPKAII